MGKMTRRKWKQCMLNQNITHLLGSCIQHFVYVQLSTFLRVSYAQFFTYPSLALRNLQDLYTIFIHDNELMKLSHMANHCQ